MKSLLAGLLVGAALVCAPAQAQTVSDATPEQAAQIYGALTYLLAADETCAILGVPMRAAAVLMQITAAKVGETTIDGQDDLARQRLAEVRGESGCGNVARDPVLAQANNLVRTETVVSQLAWDKLLQANGGECGTFLSITGKRPAYSSATEAEKAARDRSLVSLITESASMLRNQFASSPNLAQLEQVATVLSGRLDALACDNPDFSEILLDSGVGLGLGLDGGELMLNPDHYALVDDSPWAAINAARIFRSMLDDGFMADGYLAVENSFFAYRMARSNRENTFAVRKSTATWIDADTDEELPAAQIIFGVLTDNRIAIAMRSFDGVPVAIDAMIEAAGTAARLVEIGTYDVAHGESASIHNLYVVEAEDAEKLLAAETLRISLRHQGGLVSTLKEWDLPDVAALNKAIAYAAAPQPQ